jgi:peptidylprolyl isomerase
MKTTLGDIKVRLYNETPVHRDNFIKMVKSGIYDGVSFHRVIKNFMIQAGDPGTNNNLNKAQIDSLNLKTIPAEFRTNLFHKKGALAAARQGNDVNPEMRSSATQFYIVQGEKYSDDDIYQSELRVDTNIKQSLFLKLIKEMTDSARISGSKISPEEIQEKATIRMYEQMDRIGLFKYSDEQTNVYKTIGGTPRLDGTYTVFGEVVEGLDVVDKIAAVKTDSNDRPLNDIKILKMRLVKK